MHKRRECSVQGQACPSDVGRRWISGKAPDVNDCTSQRCASAAPIRDPTRQSQRRRCSSGENDDETFQLRQGQGRDGEATRALDSYIATALQVRLIDRGSKRQQDGDRLERPSIQDHDPRRLGECCACRLRRREFDQIDRDGIECDRLGLAAFPCAGVPDSGCCCVQETSPRHPARRTPAPALGRHEVSRRCARCRRASPVRRRWSRCGRPCRSAR